MLKHSVECLRIKNCLISSSHHNKLNHSRFFWQLLFSLSHHVSSQQRILNYLTGNQAYNITKNIHHIIPKPLSLNQQQIQPTFFFQNNKLWMPIAMVGQVFHNLKQTLYYMNSLSLFKLIIPTLKINNKLYTPPTDNTSKLLFTLYANLPQAAQWQALELPTAQAKIPGLVEPPMKYLPEKHDECEQDEEETTKSTCSFPLSDLQVQKNSINNRVKSLQYEANNPCEDTITYRQLQAIDAFAISIFDGHGGPQLAEYCQNKIHSFIDDHLKDHLHQYDNTGEAIRESLRYSYQRIQDSFFGVFEQHLRMGNKRIRCVGSCGITAVVHDNKVYIANCGDSQAIFLLTDGKGFKTQKASDRLSVNSKTQRERLRQEWAGIDEQIITEQSGAYYLKGRLQPTRTIGDYYLKKEQYYQGQDVFRGPYLHCLPDITQHEITSTHQYLVMASDGVWDSLSKNQVGAILLKQREIDLSKTWYDLQEQEPPYLSSVLNSILQKASQMSSISMHELKALPRGQRRNYHDDITLAVIDLKQQI